jgi:hypothetical protein
MLSTVLKLDPNLAKPYTLMDDPNRTHVLIDKELPIKTASRTLQVLPNLVIP